MTPVEKEKSYATVVYIDKIVHVTQLLSMGVYIGQMIVCFAKLRPPWF